MWGRHACGRYCVRARPRACAHAYGRAAGAKGGRGEGGRERREALKERKPIILLHETDDRHGKFDFDTETNVPEDFRPKARQLLSDNESLGWARRDYAQEAVLNQIKRRFYKSLKSGGAGGGEKEMRKEQ